MRKIPTIIGLVLVIALVGLTAVISTVMKNTTSLFSRASADFVFGPEIGNVSDTGLDIYWITPSPTSASVTYGLTQSANEKVVEDKNVSQSHFIHIANLKSGETYYFRVGPNAAAVSATTKVVPLEQTADPAYGKVQNTAGQPLAGAIVTIQTSDNPNEKVAAISKSDGSYVLSISSKPGQTETVMVYDFDGKTATINCKVGLDKPLPTVKIGETLNCSKTTAGSTTPVATPSSGFRVSGGGAINVVGGELIVNLKDNETVSSALPTISGKVGPNQTVQITVQSPTIYSGTVKADPTGAWSWTPPAALAPGKHTATISVVNLDGTTQTVTRVFHVSADTSILPVTLGTPSATVAHFACVNNACVRITGAGTDECVSDIDCAPPPAPPTPVGPPVETPAAPPAVPPPIPPSGALENTLLVVGLGAAMIIIGFGLTL